MLDGQGLIVGAHRQREGDGLLALDYMVAGVHVEERAVLEVLAAGGEDAVAQIADGDRRIAHNGDVARDGREARQRLVDGRRALDGVERVKTQLRAVKLGIYTVVCGDGGMDLAEHADAGIADIDLRTASGVVGGVLLLGGEAGLCSAEVAYQSFDPALDGEEVDIRAVCAEGDYLRLVRRTVGALEVYSADLIEIGGLVAVIIVAGEYLKHRGEDGRAHDGGVLAEGVQDTEAVAQRGVRRHTDLVIVAGAYEGVGDDLIQTHAAADLTDLALTLLHLAEAAARGGAAGKLRGYLIIAVEAGDLFGDVGVMRNVAAP